MCVVTTAATASVLGALGSSSVLAGTAVGGALSSTTAAAIGTVGANAAISAGLSAGVSAAFGARGRDLGRAALIGGAVGGGASAISIAASGASTAASNTVANADKTLTAAKIAKDSAAPAAAAKTYAGLTPGQWLSAGGVAAGAVGQGISSKMEADANAAALKRQAALERQRAAQVRQSAAEEAQTIARERRRLQGSQLVEAAANGVLLESSRAEALPNMLEQDAAMESDWDTEKMLYNANLQAWGYSTNAATLRYNAVSARKSGNLALSSGLVRGGILGAAGYYSGLAANEHRNATLLS